VQESGGALAEGSISNFLVVVSGHEDHW
jgi:hypothetical protein